MDGISNSSVEFLPARALVVEEFLFSWKNNSFFEDDPQGNEKIVLYCVGNTTASFEVATA